MQPVHRFRLLVIPSESAGLQQMPRRTTRSAFTLIELLSVVAIVGVLAALLAAAISTARSKSRRLVCLNNVRQIGVGISLFTTDHGEYPLGYNPHRHEGKDLAHYAGWQASVQMQIDSNLPSLPGSRWYEIGIWDCPSATRPNGWPPSTGYNDYGYNVNGLGVGTNGYATGIGGSFNPMASTTAPAIKVHEVANPSETLAAGDGFCGWNEVLQDGLLYLARWPAAEERVGSTQRSRRRHNSKANVVFCDGHAEALTLQTLFVDTSDESLRLWNRDSLPHRERLKP